LFELIVENSLSRSSLAKQGRFCRFSRMLKRNI